jgi:hypothetical protein
VTFVVMGHRAGATLFHRRAGLGAIERTNLRLLVDRQHDGMRWRVDIEADDIDELLEKRLSLDSLNLRTRWEQGHALPRCVEPNAR